MPIQPQFNSTTSNEEAPGSLGQWVNKYVIRRLAQILQGPTTKAWSTLGATFTLKLNDFALQTGILSANVTITLDIAHTRAGCFGFVELTQNGTGGWTAAWTNAVWSASTPPVVAAGAGKKTMLMFVHNGSSWVGTVLASSY